MEYTEEATLWSNAFLTAKNGCIDMMKSLGYNDLYGYSLDDIDNMPSRIKHIIARSTIYLLSDGKVDPNQLFKKSYEYQYDC